MTRTNPLWIAQRHNQDWRDEDMLRAISWLTSTVESQNWARRMDSVRQYFEAAKKKWAEGNRVQLFDPKDSIAWYVFQANASAAEREDWYEPEAYRIAPIFKRLGILIPDLSTIPNVQERAHTLLTKGKQQPDDGLFELLVAGAYKRRNWANVLFVPEQPGVAKTQDILVSGGRRRWAVECKRAGRSDYEAKENAIASELIAPVHELSRLRNRSIRLKVLFKSELFEIHTTYLAEKVEAFLQNSSHRFWDDDYGVGNVQYVNWSLMNAVLAHDDVFFGSSRMAELLNGEYLTWMDYDIAADWTPAPSRPLHATAISHASIVGWASKSSEAADRKASHFKSVIGKAAKQLPGDVPAVIHVGYEARSASSVDDFRHLRNLMKIKGFDPEQSRLRWVYGNYLSPEHTNNKNESWAISETTAPYKVGRHGTSQPLPNHLLFSDGPGQSGNHWWEF